MITVVNRRTYKGPGEWICRGKSPLGNPFKMKNENDRQKVIEEYKKWISNQLKHGNAFISTEYLRLLEMASKGNLVLICWCAPKACHGDVLKEMIEKDLEEKS